MNLVSRRQNAISFRVLLVDHSKIFLESEEYVESKAGIAAGDTVIVGGHYTLAHDARFRVERTPQ